MLRPRDDPRHVGDEYSDAATRSVGTTGEHDGEQQYRCRNSGSGPSWHGEDTTEEPSSCQSRGRFRRYGTYLREKYGAPAYRVAVDASFSCPNRSADGSTGGCLYCDEFGSRAPYSRTPAATGRSAIVRGVRDGEPGEALEASIREQVSRGLSFLSSRYGATVFLLYFQAFSGTWASLRRLEAIYDYGLSLGRFRELIVATRPDCVDRAVADLLASYRSDDCEVWVELGLQSANDATLERIRRGHTVARFSEAFSLLRERGVRIAAHLIFGLPGETAADMMSSVEYLAALEPDGVKFHDLHVPAGSGLYREYLEGELVVPTGRRHLGYLADAVERLPPSAIVMRITCDTPEVERAAPRHPTDKQLVYDRLEELLEARGTRQGCLFRR